MPTKLFTNVHGPAEGEPAVVSPSFTCDGPYDPVTVSSEELGPTETIEIRKYSENKSGYVPFRQNGQVTLAYNQTVQVIVCKGQFALFITKPTKEQVSADWDK